MNHNLTGCKFVETSFAELHDGTLVETIENPENPAEYLLAIYQNGCVQYVAEWPDGNRILVPLSSSDPMLQYIHFPSGAKRRRRPSEGEDDLLPELCHALRLCIDVDDWSRVEMAAMVVSTWFPEKLSVAPYLSLVGPPGSGKTTALRLLSLICRRGVLTADISPAAFYELSNRVAPTILIDETRTAGDPRKLLHLMRASSSRGIASLRKGKAELAFGPKIVSWVELPNDPQFCSRCLIVPMQKSARTDLRSPDDPYIIKMAAHIREDLLQFRFEHYSRVSISKVPSKGRLSGRALDLYRALAMPFADQPVVCEALEGAVAAQNQFQQELLSPVQASTLRLLHRFIHDTPDASGLRVGDLAYTLCVDLQNRGEPERPTARKVGDILTSVGLTNRHRGTNGAWFLRLDRAERTKIHTLVRSYEVDTIAFESDRKLDCDICAELNATSAPAVDPVPGKAEPDADPATG